MAAKGRCQRGSVKLQRLYVPSLISGSARLLLTRYGCGTSSTQTHLKEAVGMRQFSTQSSQQSPKPHHSPRSKGRDSSRDRRVTEAREEKMGLLWNKLIRTERETRTPMKKARIVARLQADLEREAASMRLWQYVRLMRTTSKMDTSGEIPEFQTYSKLMRELVFAKCKSTRLTVFAPLTDVGLLRRLDRALDLFITLVFWSILGPLSAVMPWLLRKRQGFEDDDNR